MLLSANIIPHSRKKASPFQKVFRIFIFTGNGGGLEKCVQKSLEERQIQIYFRMPLHRDDIVPLKRLDCSIFRGSGHTEARRCVQCALSVIRVDLYDFCSVDSMQERVLGNFDPLSAGDVVVIGDQLVQCASEVYIQHLQTAANRQNRLSGFDKRVNKRKIPGVFIHGIGVRHLRKPCVSVVFRIYVFVGAGQYETIADSANLFRAVVRDHRKQNDPHWIKDLLEMVINTEQIVPGGLGRRVEGSRGNCKNHSISPVFIFYHSGI